MAITRPTGEQLRFLSANTGEHILDTYMEAAEIGGRQLSDLLDDLFDPANSGTFRSENFEFRYNETTSTLQFRAGVFSNSSASFVDVTSFFSVEGTFSTSTSYNNFDLVTVANSDVYLVHGLSSPSTFGSESAFISSSSTKKIVDVSGAQVQAAISSDHRADAAKYAITAEDTSFTLTSTNGSTSGLFSALHYNAKASANATTATTQAGLASDQRADAAKYAVTAHNTTFSLTSTNGGTSGLYSSLHYATESSNSAATASGHKDTASNFATAPTGTLSSGSAKAWALGGGASFTMATAIAGSNFSSKYYADQSSQHASTSLGHANTSSTHKNTASDHKDDAGKYAVTAHNTTFTLTSTNGGTSGLYSALHYATESANSATDSATAKTGAETARTGAETAETDAQTAQAASEAARDASVVAKTASETARDASVTAKTASETARDASVVAKNSSETARDASIAAKNLSETAKTNAETAETNAETAETNASASATAAANSATAASNTASTIGTIDSLSDVTITSVADNEVIAYDSSSSKFINQTAAEAGIATTAYTDTAISNLVDSSPAALNTLNELASALGDDANFSTTVTNSLATKMPLAGGTFTGDVTISSGTSGDAVLTIEADTDNNDENDHPEILFKQDGGIPEGGIKLANNKTAVWNSVSTGGGLSFRTGTADTGYSNATERMEISSIGDITLKGASHDVVWDTSENSLEFADNAKITFGNTPDTTISRASAGVVNINSNAILTSATGAAISHTQASSTITDFASAASAEAIPFAIALG
jgi:hypothetical protein